MKSGTKAKSAIWLTAAGLTIFVLLVVGGPYSFMIYKACEPAGIGEFFAGVAAFHTIEGC